MQNEESKEKPAPPTEAQQEAPAPKTEQNLIEYSIEKATATQTMVITSIAVSSTFIILYAVFMIYLGIYAYGNPDPSRSFYIDGLDTTGLTAEAVETLARSEDIKIRPGYPIDMAHLFRTWFLWGFWGCIFQVCILATVIPLCFCLKSQLNVLNIVGGVFEAISCCSSVAWFILGFFWRFSRAGRVASGEKLDRQAGLSDDEWKTQLQNAVDSDGYQIQSGKFMAHFLWIVLVFILMAVAAGSVGVILTCCQNDKAAELSDNADAETGDKKKEEAEVEKSSLLQTAQ